MPKINNRVFEAHRVFIRSLPCAACGKWPTVAAHCRLPYFGDVTVPDGIDGERGGEGIKPHDKWITPLCPECHGIQHESSRRNSSERQFWEERGINPLALCEALYRNRDNRGACLGILQRARMGATL